MSQLLKKLNMKIKETSKNIRKVGIIFFVLLSLIFLIIMLSGSINGNVNLNTFTFEDSILIILRINHIKFTLFGYCIDDKCNKNVLHNFDKGKL